jgi:hypothetical protein
LYFPSLSLSKQEREQQKRIATPSQIAVDSQSVKQSGCFSGQVGADGHKKRDGRKRHLAVDSLGLPWAMRIPHKVRWSAHVGAADQQDGIAGLELMPQLAKVTSNLSLICVDNAYKGSFIYYAAFYGWQAEISQKHLQP